MKTNKNIIDFFKQLNMYDEKTFNYINKNSKNYILEEDYNNFKINLKIKNNKLTGFDVILPLIKNNNTMLINIYLYALSIYYYNKIGKVLNDDNLKYILPITLVRIYTEINLGTSFKNKLDKYQLEKALESDDILLLLAYDYQFDILKEYLNNNIILKPDVFYVDDSNRLKESCLIKLGYYD